MLLWRAALGVSRFGRCRCRFGLSVHYMIGGVFGVVKGGFSGICRRMQDRGDSRLRGNDGRGVGMTTGGFAIRRRPILRKRKRNHHEESLAI